MNHQLTATIIKVLTEAEGPLKAKKVARRVIGRIGEPLSFTAANIISLLPQESRKARPRWRRVGWGLYEKDCDACSDRGAAGAEKD